jgi:hypothetical protein
VLRRALSWRRARLGAALLLVATAAPADDREPVPWPGGAPPTAEALDAMVSDAVERADREEREAFLSAREEGEDREHMTAFQWDIDEGRLDPAALFLRGDTFFEHEFSRIDGLGDGAALQPPRRVHAGGRGGVDTFSCAGCHSVGGPDGAGSETQNALVLGDGTRASSALVRNPPAVLGLGLVQALGVEMTRELRGARDGAVARARREGAAVTVALQSKGVSFGAITARPDGSVDTSAVAGVSADLEVRPFGWKGDVARLRRFAEEAARVHFGVQAHTLAERHRASPDPARLGDGADWWDPDGDRVQRELEEGTLTAAAVYMAMLETPVEIPPTDPALRARHARGRSLVEAIGCLGCHREELPLDDATWREAPDTTGGPPVVLNLLRDGDTPRGTARVRLYSDLRRHDLGDGLRDPRDSPDGVPAATFLTRPLWGLAETPPYLHDGRAATIPEAILAHGGEARASRDTFAALPAGSRADVHIFLLSLTRAPRARVAR